MANEAERALKIKTQQGSTFAARIEAYLLLLNKNFDFQVIYWNCILRWTESNRKTDIYHGVYWLPNFKLMQCLYHIL